MWEFDLEAGLIFGMGGIILELRGWEGIFFMVLLAFIWVLRDKGVLGWVVEDWREGEGVGEMVLGELERDVVGLEEEGVGG